MIYYFKFFACEHLTLCLSTSLRHTVFLHGHWSDDYVHLEGLNFLTTLLSMFRNELGFTTYRLENITDTNKNTQVKMLALVYGYCVGILNNIQLRYLYVLAI